MAGAEFERVVVGMADGRLQRIAAEVRSQRPACSVHLSAGDGIVDRVFAAGSAGERSGLHFAGLAQAQAQRGIAGIGLDQHALAMARSAHIARAEDSFRPRLALDGKHPLVRVGNAVMDVVAGNAADRLIGAPVDARVGMAARRVQRGKRVRKWLAVVLAVGRGDERRGEQAAARGWCKWCHRERWRPVR